MSATGSPRRVMRTVWPVACTRRKTAEQVALNFEIAIVSIGSVSVIQPTTSSVTMALDYHPMCARLLVKMAVDARSGPSAPSGAPKARSRLGEICTIAEVAEYLKIPKKSVYKLVGSGDLPAFKVGKHWRVLRSELGKWIARQSAQKGELAK